MRRDTVTNTVADAGRFERAHGPENNGDHHQRVNEARESDFSMPFVDCGGCDKGHCLMCSVRRVCEWRPTA